jgi:hypothetical protein
VEQMMIFTNIVNYGESYFISYVIREDLTVNSNQEFALGLLHTPPHNGRTYPLLTLPTVMRVVVFHHQVAAHSEQTKK